MKTVLSEDQLEELNDGDIITVRPGSTEINIHPPCGDDHTWTRYGVGQSDEGRFLYRTCGTCNERDKIQLDFDMLFEGEPDDLGGLWDPREAIEANDSEGEQDG